MQAGSKEQIQKSLKNELFKIAAISFNFFNKQQAVCPFGRHNNK